MYRSIYQLLAVIFSGFLVSCASLQPKPYELFGGAEKVALVVDYFIVEIGHDQEIFPFFADTNVDRFSEKMIEQICVELEGPCAYTGDTMSRAHAGMKISAAQFNRVVELLINAMERADVDTRAQNILLSRLAPMRQEIMSTRPPVYIEPEVL